MEVLSLITLFLIKHTIADYFMQYGWMIKDKGTYGAWGGVAHAKFHGALTWLVLTIFSIGWPLAFALGVADAFIHYHVDYIKSNFWKSKKLTAMDQQYWIAHGVDQLAHLLTYIGIVYILCELNLI